MSIHPYPAALESEVALQDGTLVEIRPMRPEDAELEARFVDGLSEQSRYQRFMEHLPQLTPAMLDRFTHPEYVRELALVALFDGEFIAIGRYAPNADDTAEFALVVADAWQAKGLGRILLVKLRDEARKTGYRALYGNIMAENHDMLNLAHSLGFVLQHRPGPEVTVVSHL